MEDEGGEFLREICREQKLMIPSTFDCWHEGQTHTFTSANGGRSRIDYILMPQELGASVVRSFVHQDFDLMNGDRDHFPLCLECDIKVGEKDVVRRFNRSPLYHRAEAMKKHQNAAMQDILVNCPSVDWSVDVNDHWNWVRHHLQQKIKNIFPCQKRQQRQLYFSNEAWNVLCSRKEIRKQYRALQREKRILMLRAIWQAWKGNMQDCEAEETLRMPLHFLRCRQEAVTFEARIKIDHDFKCIKRRDWRQWIKQQLVDKVEKAKGVRSAELFKILRPKQMIARSTGKLIRQLPGLCGEDGQWKNNRDAIALEWQTQFGTIENAEEVTAVELLQRSVSRHEGCWQASDLLSIPSLYHLESAIRALQAAKATGLDGLGAEVLQADPVVAAKKLYPILLKAAVRGQGVMEFAGGWLLPLFKGRGNPQNMAGYRAILLESVVSRAFSKAWRPLITEGLARVARPMQWGGRQGLSIEALHLHVQFWKRNAKHQRKSHAVIFLDIKAAFYSVVKQLVAGTASGMQSLEKVFAKMNLPTDMKEEFLQQTMDVNLIKEATGSSVMANSVSAMLGLTWFVIPESKTLQAPMTGSRPGDPSADVLFSLVLSKVIGVIEERAQQIGIPLSRETTAGQVSSMVTWVDDIAFSITEDADRLVGKTMDLLVIVQDAMLEHGLSLSYGVGKTAVMISFHGKGATAARQETERKYGQGLALMSEHKGKVIIPIVGHYRHLGGFITRSGSRIPELRVRTVGALSKLKPLRRILVHEGLQKEQRSRLIKSLGLSVFTLHAGTLFALTQGEYQVWQAGIHKIYQSLHQRKANGEVQHCTMYQLADAMQSPMPMELMYLCRLRLLVHLFKTGDAYMIAAIVENFEIEKENSWLQGVFHSLKWLENQVGSEHVPEELFQLMDPQVWKWFQAGAHELKGLIKKAEQSHLCKVKSFCELKTHAEVQDQICREMGWTLEDEFEKEEKSSTDACFFECTECGAQFDKAFSLATHEQRKHNKRVALRRVACDAACRACGRFYHTRPRMIKHLQMAKSGCWIFHLRNYFPMSEEAAAELDERDRKLGVATHQKGLVEHSLDQGWRWCTDQEREHVLLLKEHPPVKDGAPTEQELAEWSALGMLPPGQGGRQITSRNATEWTVHNVGQEATKFEHQLLDRATRWNPNPDWIPRGPADGRRFFLILFSGHRRFEDLASYIWWQSNLIPICVDVAIHPEIGNMLEIGLWRSLIHARRVAGGHAGPPCETYSLARWLEIEDSIYPRPLRSCDQPWGLDGRTLRETRQWMMGNILMWRALLLLFTIYAYGGSFTLEHPKGCGGKDNKWTIWDSSFIKQLMLAGDIKLWTILQGPLGQPFAKPTNLMAARLERLGAAIYEGYDKRWRPTTKLGGREGTQWKTARAKAYPPALCRILAQQHIAFAEQQIGEGTTQEPEGLERALHALANSYDPYWLEARGTKMCSDYSFGKITEDSVVT